MLGVGVVYPLHKPVGVRTPDVLCSRQMGPYRYSTGAKDGTSIDGQQCGMQKQHVLQAEHWLWQFRHSCTGLLASTKSQHAGQPVMLACRLHLLALSAHGTLSSSLPSTARSS